MFDDVIDEQRTEARWAGDDRLFVRFSVEPLLNPFKSTEAGRPIYDEVEMITIISPGNRLSSVHAIVDDTYKARFRDKYRRWKQGLAEEVSGTPLEAWGKLGVSQVAELKALNIRTVEQLAAMSDSDGNATMMGFYGLKEAAQNFIVASAGKAGDMKLAKELETRDAEIALLKDQMAQLIKVQETKAK